MTTTPVDTIPLSTLSRSDCGLVPSDDYYVVNRANSLVLESPTEDARVIGVQKRLFRDNRQIWNIRVQEQRPSYNIPRCTIQNEGVGQYMQPEPDGMHLVLGERETGFGLLLLEKIHKGYEVVFLRESSNKRVLAVSLSGKHSGNKAMLQGWEVDKENQIFLLQPVENSD